MTVAVCWKCGEMKWGAFTPCETCRAIPETEDDLATSLALTDHYCDKGMLQRMSADIAGGQPIRLAPETRAQLIKMIRDTDIPMYRDVTKARDIDYEPSKAKKAWWKIL